MCDDKCTCGDVFITRRIEEHENYNLFNSTIYLVLSNGISWLQDTSFIFLKLFTGNCQVIPVPYNAVLNALHPLDPNIQFLADNYTHKNYLYSNSNNNNNNNNVILFLYELNILERILYLSITTN